MYGIHSFWLHPFLVAISWWKLYGFPWDYRLWFAFFLHDIGYFGKKCMDDEIGETHPELGALVMRKLFGDEWGDFTLLHSRFYSKRLGRLVSKLCYADKYVIILTPWWLFIPLAWITGEIEEYKKVDIERGECNELITKDLVKWYKHIQKNMMEYINVRNQSA